MANIIQQRGSNNPLSGTRLDRRHVGMWITILSSIVIDTGEIGCVSEGHTNVTLAITMKEVLLAHLAGATWFLHCDRADV